MLIYRCGEIGNRKGGTAQMIKNELRSIMVKNGDTGVELAKALNMTAPSLSMKINGKKPFKLKDVAAIAERYELSGDDIKRIFFTLKVANKETRGA